MGIIAFFAVSFMASVYAVGGSFTAPGYSQSCNYSGFNFSGSSLTVNVTSPTCLDSKISSSSGSTGGSSGSTGGTSGSGGTASCVAENGSVAHNTNVSIFSYKNVGSDRCNIASRASCSNGVFGYVTVGGGGIVDKEWINTTTCGATATGGGQVGAATCTLADGTSMPKTTNYLTKPFYKKGSCTTVKSFFCAGNNLLTNELSPAESSGSSTYYSSLDVCLGTQSKGVSFGYSDVRLKENITPVINSLEKVAQLNGVNFNWKDTGRYDLGVIAQDVEKVAPEIVVTMENGYKAVDYPKLSALLIEAVKDLQEQNIYLLSEITILKNR